MAKKSQLDQDIEQAYYRYGDGVQINILDIPKLFQDVRLAVGAGAHVDDEVKAAILKYRKN